MKIKIAVVQFGSNKISPQENLGRAENFIKKAALLAANIIVFPENFITSSISDNEKAADSKNKYRKYFQDLAKKYNIDIVPGSIIEKDKSKLYNTSYYIDSVGDIKARYKKINLWHSEKEEFAPGQEISVFDTKYGKMGLVICWDLIYPEIFREMAKRGVEIVFCPSSGGYEDAGKIGNHYDPNSEIKLVDSLCAARAFENEIILVYCNAGGKIQLENFIDTLIGHSQITMPFRGVVKKLAHNQEEMFVEEVDTAILKDAEKVYGIRADLKKINFR